MGGIMFIIGILIATVVAVPCYWQISSDNVFQMSETGLMATKIFADSLSGPGLWPDRLFGRLY